VPCLIFHFLNNAIAVSQGSIANAAWARPIISWIYRNPDAGLYHVAWIVGSAIVSAVLLFYLWRLKFDRSSQAHSKSIQPVEPACQTELHPL
jgi:sodium transport system permease protein